eukprot:4316050-Pyramimonas_sp.AAC.1
MASPRSLPLLPRRAGAHPSPAYPLPLDLERVGGEVSERGLGLKMDTRGPPTAQDEPQDGP